MNEEINTIKEEQLNKGNIIEANINDEMQKAYLDYAMSVIVGRALPDVRDGLKPVQRRIIYAMFEGGMLPNSQTKKCAAIVGDVLKNYHPHGDSSVYEALVRMAQDFSLRYPLIIGQGNFGSIDGDSAAAYRYTEAKLSKISMELLKNIREETVNYMPNYSGDTEEPILLPSVIPNLLLNGANGIAVGMATSIPAHNMSELIDGLIATIDKYKPNPEKLILLPKAKQPFETNSEKTERKLIKETRQIPIFESEITTEELIEFVKGPDFPTGGVIYDKSAIANAYSTGRGRIIVRGIANIEEVKGNKFRIIISELPYQVNKAVLVARIADLVRDKKIEGISDIRDESNRQGIRVVIELRATAQPQKILNQLFKYTALQSSFNCNFVALLNNEPKLFTLKMILEEFVIFRQEVIIRRNEFQLAELLEREHILQGLKIALDNIDEVIQTIKKSESADAAKVALMDRFKFTLVQAEHILDMQLRKLARLEREKIEAELKEILGKIATIKNLLASPEKILVEIKNEFLELKQTYNDTRRTKIIKGKIGEFNEEDLIAQEKTIVTLTKSGYIKRAKADTYKKQGRGGKGLRGMTTKEGDSISQVVFANTHDELLFFTDNGRCFKKKVWDLPESSRIAKGTNVVNLLNLQPQEKVSAIVATEDIDNYKYIVFTTQNGVGKKTDVNEFKNLRQNGLIAVKLKDKDKLVAVNFTKGTNKILLTSKNGKALKFNEKDLRPMGRSASGVRIMNVGENNLLVNAQVIPDDENNYYTLTLSENGFGKRTPVTSYAVQKRGGKGLKTAQVTKKTGELVDSLLVGTKGEIIITSNNGQLIRLGLERIPVLSRATQGVRLIRFNESDKDKVSSIALIEEDTAEGE